MTTMMGSRDCAVVRALAFHHCGRGSIPGPGVICGLSLLLVLVLAPRVFPGYYGFPPSIKTNISKVQFDLDVGHSLTVIMHPTEIKCLFIYL